ncbi:MAG TPA: c-type cytochrome [Candidatus Cybelea sp.]|nr:c-type cytochrome [Candidatus Cybelea sp.]
MKNVLLVLVVSVALAGSAAAGAEEAKTLADKYCASCHGPSGNSASSFFPRLAGQSKEYFVGRLTGFRDFSRVDPHVQYFMGRNAFRLSRQDIDALAAYYAAQPPAAGERGDAAVMAHGQTIYRDGIPSRSIAGCAICHGPAAEGKGPAPRLAGQHEFYLQRQLAIFRVGLRRSGTAHPKVSGLEADDIDALAAYLASL